MIGGKGCPDITVGTLNNAAVTASAVFGTVAVGGETRILQDHPSAGVHIVHDVGIVFCIQRHAKQSHYIVQTVNIQIHPAAASLIMVKGRGDFTGPKGIQTGRSLGENAFHIPYGTDSGQPLENHMIRAHMNGGNGFKEKQVLLICKIFQFHRLVKISGNGLFHNYMEPILQCCFAEFIVRNVGNRYVYRVNSRGKQSIQIISSQRNMISLTECCGSFDPPGVNTENVNTFHLKKFREKRGNDHTSADNTEFHVKPPSSNISLKYHKTEQM